MQNKYKWFCLASLLLIVIAAGWYFSRAYPPSIKLSPTEEIHMKELLTGMKTHCVGRYLIDLPTSFTLSTGTAPFEEDQPVADIKWPENSYQTDIASKRMYYPAFEQMLKRREKELSETRTHNLDNMPFLKKIWPLPAGMKGIIFERNLDTSSDDALRTLEAYLYSEGVAIKLQKKSANDLSPRYKKDREKRGSETNYIPGDLARINDLLHRIRGREVDDIPRNAGSCVANAFIAANKKGDEEEDIAFVFSIENLPGFNFVVSTNNTLQEKKSLLERAGDIRKTISAVNGRIIRKGSVNVNSLQAEEMFITGPKPESDCPVYIFDIYVNETRGSNKTPWLNVTMTNARNSIIPDAGYSQDELMAFWSTVTQTLRMRPVVN